jgi:DNA-binding protein HU-beta
MGGCRDHVEEKSMNKGELVGAVAEKVGLSRGQVGEAIDAALDVITGALKKGEEVKLVGFGTFVVTDRAAGEARNPRTGERVSVPASKMPKFRAGAGLKDAVNAK